MDWLLRWLPNASPERLAELERNLQAAGWWLGMIAVLATAGSVTAFVLAWGAGKLEARAKDEQRTAETARLVAKQERMAQEVVRTKDVVVQTEKRTTELEKKVATRQLAPEQRKKLVARLAEGKGTRISILAPMGDVEADAFRQELAAALREAGWEVNTGANVVGPMPPGLSIVVANPNRLREDQALLKRALDDAGIIVGPHPNPDAPPLLNLLVGPKPQ